MNIAEILKDYPKGTKLYSTVFGECYLENVSICLPYPIEVRIPNSEEDLCRTFDSEEEDLYESFNEEGKYTPTGECCLFPSKDNRDWSTFKVDHEFKRGDFIYLKMKGNNDVWLSIFNCTDGDKFLCFVNYSPDGDDFDGDDFVDISEMGDQFILSTHAFERRLATEEEKKKLLKRINKAGYSWDSEKLELVKIHQKHDLEPFEKVLVRDSEDEKWLASLFSHYEYESSFYKFCCIDGRWQQCIPYEGNEHLLGTKNNPKE